MKLLVTCPLCREAAPQHALLRDDGAADVECVNGHSFVVVSRHAKYEILFESASLALLEGYPREAAFGFCSSLEQFYAWFLQEVTQFRPSDDSGTLSMDLVDKCEHDKTWRLVSAQSQRQLGAFFFSYLSFTGRAYSFVDLKWLTTMRNKVVHQGLLVTPGDAKSLGEKVWKEIRRLEDELVDQITTPVDDELHSRIDRIQEESCHPVIEHEHAIMLSRDQDMGSFNERLMQLRTKLPGVRYGRGQGGA